MFQKSKFKYSTDITITIVDDNTPMLQDGGSVCISILRGLTSLE